MDGQSKEPRSLEACWSGGQVAPIGRKEEGSLELKTSLKTLFSVDHFPEGKVAEI
jgi:hypothetical protein